MQHNSSCVRDHNRLFDALSEQEKQRLAQEAAKAEDPEIAAAQYVNTHEIEFEARASKERAGCDTSSSLLGEELGWTDSDSALGSSR